VNHPLERDNRNARMAAAYEEKRLKQLRADLREVMEIPGGRRVIAQFLHDMGVDSSPFSPNAMTQSRDIGRQEGGRWWLDSIRAACPEKEPVMRADWNRLQKQRDEEIPNEY
jgi:hypothetical protein